jgi:hypothetical protein
MKLELTFKQAMAIQELVKTAKTEANIKAYSLQDKFKAESLLSDDAKEYWAEQQDKHNNAYDFYNGILETLRDATGTI